MLLRLGFVLVIFFSLSVGNSFSQKENEMAGTVIHLLSYVSMDYAGAVEDGEILNELEYLEQQEFSQRAYELTEESSFLGEGVKKEVLQEINQLIVLVNDKKDADEISEIIQSIKNKIIAETGLVTSPLEWPSSKNGRKLYAQTCAQCHGTTGRGDGKQGLGLDPAPSDFYDEDLMNNFSPYQAYNSIRLGVLGTGMQAYSNFSEQELWDLAFYVKSMRFSGEDTLVLRKELEELKEKISLEDIANATDQELLDLLQELKVDNATEKLKALRVLKPRYEGTENSLPIAKTKLLEAFENYRQGNKREARNLAISAYLEGIEPIEARLKSIDPSMVAKIEKQMFRVRQSIDNNIEVSELSEEIQEAIVIIGEINDLLQGQKLNYWLTFVLAASIMLREGLEAFLIIAVVLALIRNMKLKKALPWLHGGWILAVIMGIAGWFLSDYIIKFGGKNREIMEGLVSLLAVAVLIFVGFWLHSHSNAKKWQEFVQVKIGKHLEKDRMYGLAAFSFMIVFREAFEVVLFLQAINLEAEAQDKSAIGAGVITASIVIALIAYLFLKSTKKLPIRQLFIYSSLLVVLLAIILMGKGVHSLQESGWVGVTNIPFVRIDWLGIFPTLQTVLMQLALILLVIGTFFIQRKKVKN